MALPGWTPWRNVAKVREDLKSGELSLAMFAADLHDVSIGRAKAVYQDPRAFFSLTYPTYNLRDLAKDVVLRLAGKSDRAVRQLALTYGGGKTHTLIALYHLTKDPSKLPDLPSVHEFTQHIGMTPPKARIAVLAFDQLDPVTGTDVYAPGGASARFKYPWTVLAFQLGGDEGLRILGSADGTEREEPPFTNVLEELLALPERDGEATLILIDEVLMWARTKVGTDPVWRSRIQDFFQCLTQAATKVDHCAIVASLLATDPARSDALGAELTSDLYAVFQREREEAVQPVLKEDVAEVLRRRFFTPDSIRDRAAFRPHVVAALQGINGLDGQAAKEGLVAENRYVQSYPFHPDLTDVFYSRWTNLENFQRTRGVLRTFALALRDAENWDDAPLVAANVFLGPPGAADISDAARELTTVASGQADGGVGQNWSAILLGELEKARAIEADFPGLRHRELQAAVTATFLYSQPVGQKAVTRDLLVLLGHTRPDKIDLEGALQRWSDESWFLDESDLGDLTPTADGVRPLPKAWRLGRRPNLRQMHHAALLGVESILEARLLKEIAGLKSLTIGASGADAKVHSLPAGARDVVDDGSFHYVVLGPTAASDPGRPSAEARRYLEQTTGADRPRVNKNAVVILTPSSTGLNSARGAIRDFLAWEVVRDSLKDQNLDPTRAALLVSYVDESRKKIPDAIRQAYRVVVTMSARNEVEAFEITVGSEPLFSRFKADPRSRILDSAVSSEALMPGGPYDLWKDQTTRRVKDLIGAFAQDTRLPKMLNQSAILDTLLHGCIDGLLVMQVSRPDHSFRTFWRSRPDDVALADSTLEAVLPEAASISDLLPTLLAPKTLPGLWSADTISVGDVYAYFRGGNVVKIARDGYDEPVIIPKSERVTVTAAIEAAVRGGTLWLTSGPATILAETVPTGLIANESILQAPPAPIPAAGVTSEQLPDAWVSGSTTALSILSALSLQIGKNLPWVTVRDGIDGAIRARLIERAPDSGPWPCDFTGAGRVTLVVPSTPPPIPPPPPPPPEPGVWRGQAELTIGEVQNLGDNIGDVRAAAVGHNLKVIVVIELGGTSALMDDVVAKVNVALAKVSAKLKLQ